MNWPLFNHISCTINCKTILGKSIREFGIDGLLCDDNERKYCQFGDCVIYREHDRPTDLVDLKIRIKSAAIPEIDNVKSLSTYVNLFVNRLGDPVLKDGELICQTPIREGINLPCWDNFVCRPPSLRSGTQLTFTVNQWDGKIKRRSSSKVVASETEKIDYLFERGAYKVSISRNKSEDFDMFVEVELTSRNTRVSSLHPF